MCAFKVFEKYFGIGKYFEYFTTNENVQLTVSIYLPLYNRTPVVIKLISCPESKVIN